MYPHYFRAGLLVVLAGLLIACSGEAEKADGSAIPELSGDVSLIGASVTVTDANGDTVADTLSDESAQYEVSIPPDTPLPLTITARGGNDLLLGGASEIDRVAVTFGASSTANVSPLTTLAARMVECAGPVSEASLDHSWSLIANELPMGMGAPVSSMGQPVTSANAAVVVLANEALLEAMRRVRAALAGGGASVSVDEVLTRIACDLVEDAVLNGAGSGADARTTATFHAAQAAVLLEVIAGQLHIAGQNATQLLDLAIVTMLGTTGISVSDLVVSSQLVEQARAAISLFLAEFSDDELLTLAALLGGTNPIAVASDVAGALDATHQTLLWGVPDRVALADTSIISALAGRMNAQGSASAPSISFAASDSSVNNGSTTTLSWASAAADRCLASGGWTGGVGLNGSYTTGGLTRATDYLLACSGLGGTSTASVRVVVANPDPAPTATLSAESQSLEAGSSTVLNWSSSNANQCQASGAWNGARGTSGSASTGVLNSTQTYTLTCSGSGGSETTSTTVTVNPSPGPAPAPSISLSVADQQLDSGASTTLTWTSANASSCSASGGWSGTKSLNGNQSVGPINADSTYILTCLGSGGSNTASVSVTVNPPTGPVPTVSLSAADQLLVSGGSTTLTWSSADASSCTASGGWSGGKSVNGTEAVGPVTAMTTYTLTCSGVGGNAMAMIAVNVNGVLSLTWVAPTENVDGSPLTDLAGYKIYYGDSSRSYLTPTVVNDATATS
ncbi:MAG: hypothetical protein OES38_10090, partial [Gammaproteobacteria bacterium]|nr:hypothetical protein [Gammaproteobacteria bacterium]